MTDAAETQIRTEELRLRIGELAAQVHENGIVFAVGSTRGTPRYQLVPLVVVGEKVKSSCVRIGPDQFRRDASDIRALIRIHDIAFGIVIRGELAAVLRRHPRYEPAAARRYLVLANMQAIVGSPGTHDEAGNIKSIMRKLIDHERRIAALETDLATAPD